MVWTLFAKYENVSEELRTNFLCEHSNVLNYAFCDLFNLQKVDLILCYA